MDIDEDHRRTIIHIDIDCFYAQVEMNKNPELRDKPVGIQQKNIVVTSNYVAREFGIKKCMLIEDALKLCPTLVLVKGEDLHDYRQVSYRITTHLQKYYSSTVERLGLDENFIDVTNLVSRKLNQYDKSKVVGAVFGCDNDKCPCGCTERLNVASQVAAEIRTSILEEFQLTTCAGIAHNKLLAKLVGSLNKPNRQTVTYPNSAVELLLLQETVGNIPGIGRATAEVLNNLNVVTVKNLQDCDIETLKRSLGYDKAKQLKDFSFGRDCTAVKQSGRPQSIGLEDSCRSKSEAEIKEKLRQLLQRLMILVQEDGRIPKTIKLTIRKYDKSTKFSHRESRQVNVNPKLFSHGSVMKLTDTSEEKLMNLIMLLFSKLVDIHKPYHITLLGLSFTKFADRAVGKSSITNFLKKNVEVQSLTSIENKSENPYLMDYTNCSSVDFNTDGSESEVEPSPKKTKLTSLMMKRRCFNLPETDCPSPSKLKVADLRLNSRDSDSGNNEQNPKPDDNHNVKCPPNVDREVFKQLPVDVQQEVWEDYKKQLGHSVKYIKMPRTKTLLDYFVKK